MFLSGWREFPSASCLTGKTTWWQLASRCCWNRARPWHASEIVSLSGRAKDLSGPRYLSKCYMFRLVKKSSVPRVVNNIDIRVSDEVMQCRIKASDIIIFTNRSIGFPIRCRQICLFVKTGYTFRPVQPSPVYLVIKILKEKSYKIFIPHVVSNIGIGFSDEGLIYRAFHNVLCDYKHL